MKSLKEALHEAWNRTESCPDGVYDGNKFCPSCLYKSLWLVLEESATRLIKADRDEN